MLIFLCDCIDPKASMTCRHCVIVVVTAVQPPYWSEITFTVENITSAGGQRCDTAAVCASVMPAAVTSRYTFNMNVRQICANI